MSATELTLAQAAERGPFLGIIQSNFYSNRTRGGGGETQSLVKASAAETKSSPLNGTKSVTVATPEKKKGKEGPEDWV